MNTSESQYSVFISYSHNDRDLCRYLTSALENRGINVWSDILIRKGQEWRSEIAKQLESRDAVIIIITQNTSGSEWVVAEGIFGYAKNKLIIPICIDNAKPPEPLANLQAAILVSDSDKAFQNIVIVDNIVKELQRYGEEQVSWVKPEIITLITSMIRSNPDAPNIHRIEQMVQSPPTHQHFRRGIAQLVLSEITNTEYGFDYFGLYQNYEMQCGLGKVLSEVGDLRDFEEFTNFIPIQINDSSYHIKASLYQVTNRLFRDYVEDDKEFFLHTFYQDHNQPWCLLDKDKETLRRSSNLLKKMITKYQSRLQNKHLISDKETLRIPTLEEWMVLSQPRAGAWTTEDLAGCNIDSGLFPEKLTLAAVGIFPGGKSRYGCHDVIGNAWEICTLDKHDPYNYDNWCIVGFDYRTPTTIIERQLQRGREAFSDPSRLSSLHNYRDNKRAVSFRLVISSSS